jgi:hypothetical protein
MGASVEEKLATQVGAKGYFGKVVLEAEAVDGKGEVTVDFDSAHADRWQSGARFGIDYVLEHIAKRKIFPQGGRIIVSYIGGHEVDTTNVVIAFVTAKALFKALNIVSSKEPKFDETTGVFSFPK